MAATTDLLNREFLECCQQGDLSQVTEYVQHHQVDVNSVEAVDGNTGLMLATREDRLEVAQFLLSLPPTDVNRVNKFGYSALMLAAQHGNLQLLDLLLARPDLSLDLTNRAGRRAEQCARKKNKELVQSKICAAREKRKVEEAAVAGEDVYSEAPLRKVLRQEKEKEDQQFVFTAETSSSPDYHEDVGAGPVDESSLTIRNILTARLENCLIDLGSTRDNMTLCLEMLKMAKKLQLEDLQTICKKGLLQHLTVDTVFEVLPAVEDDSEMKDFLLNFIVTNIDEMRLADDWKQNLRKWPEISIELIERL